MIRLELLQNRNLATLQLGTSAQLLSDHTAAEAAFSPLEIEMNSQAKIAVAVRYLQRLQHRASVPILFFFDAASAGGNGKTYRTFPAFHTERNPPWIGQGAFSRAGNI
jgi:hypothetical protein